MSDIEQLKAELEAADADREYVKQAAFGFTNEMPDGVRNAVDILVGLIQRYRDSVTMEPEHFEYAYGGVWEFSEDQLYEAQRLEDKLNQYDPDVRQAGMGEWYAQQTGYPINLFEDMELYREILVGEMKLRFGMEEDSIDEQDIDWGFGDMIFPKDLLDSWKRKYDLTEMLP